VLLLYQFVVGHTAFVHDALEAINVFLRSALADVDANMVVLANGYFLQFFADVTSVPLP
jgi:hypothetical protein